MLPTSSGLHQINCVMPNIKAMSCSTGGIPLALKPSHQSWHTTVRMSAAKNSVRLYWRRRKKLVVKRNRFFFLTRDGPDNLRGVSQAHKGELVEPPGANVPDLHRAPFPLVDDLLPGVAILTGKNGARFKTRRCMVQKQHNNCQRNLHPFQEIS